MPTARLPIDAAHRAASSDAHAIGAVTGLTDALAGKEAALGSPALDGMVLTSTADGTRSWVDAAAPQYPIYGVEWGKVETPTMTRIGSAVGMTAAVGEGANVVANDFDSVYPWSEMQTVDDSAGNVFVRIPKFYIRKTDGVSLVRIEISRTKYPGFYLPAVFYDHGRDVELDYFDYGAHLGSLDGTKLASKPGVFPLVIKNIVEFRTYAQANGAGYQQLDVHAHDVLAALFTVEFATLHSQAILAGYTAGQYSASRVALLTEASVNRVVLTNAHADLYRVGQSIDIGTSLAGREIAQNRVITQIDVVDASNKAISFDGAAVTVTAGNIVYNVGWKCGFSSGIASSSGYLTANDGKYPASYRGIESPWGDIYQFVDGVNINDYQAWVSEDASQYATNLFAAPYEQLGYMDGATNGYISALGFDAAHPFSQFPTSVAGGNLDKYYSDYYYVDTAQRIAVVGGYWNSGPYAGLRFWYLQSVSTAASLRYGGRLIRKAVSS